MALSLAFLIPILALAQATSPPVAPPSTNPFKNIYNSLSPVERDDMKAMVENKTYAGIKQLLDSRFATLPPEIHSQISSYAENVATPDIQRLMNTDLTADEKALLGAYVNATAFEKINAFWQAKIIAISAADRVAIDAYLRHRKMEQEENRGFFSKLFEKVKSIFKSKDEKTCNSATSVLSPLLALTEDERKQLNDAIQSANSPVIAALFDQKLRSQPQNVQDRISELLKENAPPAALARINSTLNANPEHANLLAQWQQSGNDSAIQEFWKRKIEALGEDDQETIEEYFEKINKHIGDCFTPAAFYKPNSQNSGTGASYVFGVQSSSNTTISGGDNTTVTSSSSSFTTPTSSSFTTPTSSPHHPIVDGVQVTNGTFHIINENGTTVQPRPQF